MRMRGVTPGESLDYTIPVEETVFGGRLMEMAHPNDTHDRAPP